MEERRIFLNSISNCRDLGGLSFRENADGGNIRPDTAVRNVRPDADGKCISRNTRARMILPGMLLRSANLSQAASEDIEKLRDEHRLSLVVDLRTDRETEEMPEQKIIESAGVSYIHCPILHEGMLGITHEFENELTHSKVYIPVMEAMYRLIVTDEICLRNLGGAVRTIMGHDFEKGSVLWHCTEGKDRCGITTSILLAALGFEQKTIMEDYLITNETNGPKAEGFYRRMIADGASEEMASFVKEAYLAKEEYLQAVLDVIFDQSASDADTISAQSPASDPVSAPAAVQASDMTAGQAFGPAAFLYEKLQLSPGLVEKFRNSVTAGI